MTNRIHDPLANPVFEDYASRLIVIATRDYERLSTTYPLRPEGHKLEAVGIVLGSLLSDGQAITAMAQRNAVEEIEQRGQLLGCRSFEHPPS